MDKETLSSTEGNGESGWSESMAEAPSSSKIDFEQRKREIEALKLDIEKAKLEEEKRELKKRRVKPEQFLTQKEKNKIERKGLLIVVCMPKKVHIDN